MTQRPIKFRAWDKAEKKMLYEVNSLRNFFINFNGEVGEHNENGNVTYNDGVQTHSDEVFLMQFTGLHDKNGNEIWEGDIVRFTIESTKKTFVESVGWNDEFACFMTQGSWIESDWVKIAPSLEVIGNIYENPELLKS